MTRTSRKSSAKKMRLICRGRISLRPNDLSFQETAPASAGTLGKVFSHERAESISLLECRAVLFPVCTHLSRFFWTGQPLTYPAVQKSGAAAEDHRLTAPPMHFPQICSVRARIRLGNPLERHVGTPVRGPARHHIQDRLVAGAEAATIDDRSTARAAGGRGRGRSRATLVCPHMLANTSACSAATARSDDSGKNSGADWAGGGKFAVDSPLEGTGFETLGPSRGMGSQRGRRIDFEGGFCRALRFQTASVVSSAAISPSDNPKRRRLQCRTSVDCDLSPCDVTAFIGQQEQNKGRDLFGRSHAFHWDQL